MSPSTPPNVVCEGGVCRIVEPEPKTVTKSQEQMPEPTSALAKLLGESLLSKDGLVPLSTISGKGKVIALYFSGAGPCRSFTPQLAEIYNDFKASHARAADWEIVFVSSDRQQESFDEYYADMPWLALPFEQRDRKATLSSKFKRDRKSTLSSKFKQEWFDEYYTDMPWLALPFELRERKSTLSSKFKQESLDEYYTDMPWLALPFDQRERKSTLSSKVKLVDKEGKEHDGTAALANKYKLIYFSALWCDEDFKSYLSEMGSFLAVPFADQPTKAALNTLFDLDGIPTLVVVDPEDNLVTTNGREAVGTDPEGVDFPWRPKPDGIPTLVVVVVVVDPEDNVVATNSREAVGTDPEGVDFPWRPKPVDLLGPYTASSLNNAPVLPFALDDTTPHVDRLGPYTASSLNDGPVLLLALDDTTPEEGAARSEELLGDVARATLAAGEDMEPMRAGKETVVLLDVPSQCFYKMGAEMAPGAEGGYYPSGAITGSAIQELVSQYLAGSLPKIPLA
eukprot:gene31173-6316_t